MQFITRERIFLKICVLLVLLMSQAACAPCAGNAFEQLPAHFSGNRIFVRPETQSGTTLNLYTDTGGGLVITSDIVERLDLETQEISAEGDAVTVASLPEFKGSKSIPPIPVLPNAPATMQGHLPVVPTKEAPDYFGDGILGQVWFAQRVWLLDYPHQKLFFAASEDSAAYDAAHTVPIYFKSDSSGQPVAYWPRIQAQVNGETLDFLLDTGALLTLSDRAQTALADEEPKVRATSFMISSIFDAWRDRHPDWRVIEQAEEQTGESIIEVPQMTIAGHTVGPVWFTRRADENFSEAFVSDLTDQPVVGALGGSLFQYFCMTLNYPEEVAYFKSVSRN